MDTPLSKSTPEQRQAWNNFLRFVKEKGYSGSKDLDKKDQTLGLSLLEEFNAKSPIKLEKDFISVAQKEIADMAKGIFPDADGNQSTVMRRFLPDTYLNTPSPVDGWFGSLTSRMAYPEFNYRSSSGHAEDFGADYAKFVKAPAFDIYKNIAKL